MRTHFRHRGRGLRFREVFVCSRQLVLQDAAVLSLEYHRDGECGLTLLRPAWREPLLVACLPGRPCTTWRLVRLKITGAQAIAGPRPLATPPSQHASTRHLRNASSYCQETRQTLKVGDEATVGVSNQPRAYWGYSISYTIYPARLSRP